MKLIITLVLVHFKGSKAVAVVGALASRQCGPGSNPGVEAIVVGVLSLAPRGFGYSGFPLSSKTSTSKYDLERTDTFQRVLVNSQVLRG